MFKISFPEGKKFAFTIFDDTDRATAEGVRPVYELLNELGFKTTKSVWVFPSKDPNYPRYRTQTLEDQDYLNFIKWLKDNGFEIALHGVAADGSKRERVISGIERFYELLGFYPRSFAHHYFKNYESIYWGKERLNSPLLKLLMGLSKKKVKSLGHLKDSPYFWGDICQKYISYVRNFTFKEINLLKINPSLPYFDPKKPFVPLWFSSSEGMNVKDFNRLLSRQGKLEREGGVCIVYTHFAFGFAEGGKVNSETKKLLEELSKRNGWFVPVSQLLDYLREQRENLTIPKIGLKKMEWRWFLEKILNRIF